VIRCDLLRQVSSVARAVFEGSTPSQVVSGCSLLQH
jgi:hypothetical protein